MAYLVGNRGGTGLPFLPTTRGGWGRRSKPPQVQAHSSHASPSATGEVDGRVTLDGGGPDLVLA
jgi:hypothetical protein